MACVVHDVSQHLLLVVGGTGYVGSNILQRAVQKGITVRSLNRGGRPAWDNTPWLDKVEWFKGDVFSKDDLQKAVAGTTGVISTVGAFGSNEHMQRFCGDATIAAVRAAKEAGTERFVFISESRVGSNIPKWAPLYGYFNGKERAEAAVRAQYVQHRHPPRIGQSDVNLAASPTRVCPSVLDLSMVPVECT
ncbi:hypothetical protein, variant 3 [Aphanomyces invadans]|uniref:NAD(P)-binding domain-containing protein n=1 Tax=Aphanomyces invadans TaxID=157072 RepID=A0A024TWD8_9STRA|nr:hypothetical protein, variant 2 [Aphanomyces invadans]XP_008872653.1 hypothetical protein, variant 3 [Aphanomyces invadans]ETV98455.1 hypothetical protein, variant 2 [Aphanomyces invadans]ETV98456.1 hypothetical protein, variant 3 [Aphanomyces invadans]|eukprot:XP_008872652.1 hypothetical protein, variant 2 [Aphanomyces invadans]